MSADPKLFDRVLARTDNWVENALDPQALAAALRILLAHHEPAHLHAGALARLGLGPHKCSLCARHGEPLSVFRDYLNGSAEKVEMHCHGYWDCCSECRDVVDDDGELTYPCPPVQAVAEVLGVK